VLNLGLQIFLLWPHKPVYYCFLHVAASLRQQSYLHLTSCINYWCSFTLF